MANVHTASGADSPLAPWLKPSLGVRINRLLATMLSLRGCDESCRPTQQFNRATTVATTYRAKLPQLMVGCGMKYVRANRVLV